MIIGVDGAEPLQATVARVRAAGRTPYVVHGADKRALLASFADVLGFGDYFGMNLDALADCLRDVRLTLPASIVWNDALTFAHAEPRTYGVVREILRATLPDEIEVLLCLR